MPLLPREATARYCVPYNTAHYRAISTISGQICRVLLDHP
ncbi:hypothetical protein FRUB_05616 [Fimbriiglobus ruber]|uniref:Uncharacterized protein n=1 Tax=Fimbriiglobus ruber TaxID=1908690 RepID=A0A225DQB1_9BACT|nr:hypothetical protein FRUB_05616 [Fimbriiglobus ruber]